MDLDRRQAELRSRGSFEAIDLGFAMTRRWAGPVWKGWLVGVVPVLALLWLSSLIIPAPLVVLVVWWLKPLFERVPLFVLSRSLFGATPTTAQTLRALPGLYWHRMATALTLYRIDPARSFLIPVSLLERLSGRARGRRRSVLSRGQWGAAMWLTTTCALLELTVFVGLVGMVALLLPDAPQWHPLTLIEHEGTWRVLLALWMVATSLVEPFYAGGGFGLYVNRRTRLEGWDVELVFRSLAQRLELPRVAALLLLLGFALAPGVAQASEDFTTDTGFEEAEEEVPAEPPSVAFQLDRSESARADMALETVLEDEVFGHTKEEPVWVLQESWAQRLEEVWPDSCVEDQQQQMPDSALSPIVAQVLELAFWALGALAVVALVVVLVRSRFVKDLSVDVELPEPVVGESSSPSRRVLPPSLADEARALLAAGDVEGALGLLYRGSVLHLVQVRGLEIDEGATEGEVLRIVRRRAKPLGTYFRGLTNAWLEVAYAHRTVDAERVSALIDQWPAHFVEAA